MNQDNEYFKDAVFFLQQVAKELSEKMSYEDELRLTLYFALGIERLLKGILYSLNPIYVYKSQDFKNTVALLYKDRLLDSASNNQEIAREPNADVLTCKLSILRAKSVSETTEKHKNLLFALTNFRDIIVHQPLSLLDTDKIKFLLLRNFYPLINDYSKEFGVPISYFISSNEIKLASISARYQVDIKDRIHIKLDSHRKRWKQLSNVPGFVEKMKKRTYILGEQDNIKIVDCPACGNDSVLFVEPEYDYFDYENHIVGIFVSSLKCFFCKLEITEFEEIDYLELDNLLYNEPDWLDE